MILRKIEKGRSESIKGESTLRPLFEKADKRGTGVLKFNSFVAFSEALYEKMKTTYGGAY